MFLRTTGCLWPLSECDKSTVSIRNTLFCHFPVTMVTDCEMCFSMYVLVLTRNVCQWSTFFLIFASATLFKGTMSCLSGQFVNIFTVRYIGGGLFYIPSQPSRVEAMRWMLSLSLSPPPLLSPPISLFVTFYKQYSKKQRLWCITVLKTEHSSWTGQRISAEIPIMIILHSIPQWNSMRNKSPIFYWCTPHIYAESEWLC